MVTRGGGDGGWVDGCDGGGWVDVMVVDVMVMCCWPGGWVGGWVVVVLVGGLVGG